MNKPLYQPESYYEQIADALATNGYIILPNFLPTALTQQLYQHVSNLPVEQFKSAGIGRQQGAHINNDIRNDHTRWLSSDDDVEQAYLAMMDEIRMQLNQRLYLSLHDYEAHFAHYPKGSFYQRHIDAFQGKSNRIVTTVCYLNDDWRSADAGELVIYHPDKHEQEIARVLPQSATMVIFLSEQFPHEVLAANRDRYSIAGWFRIDRPIL